MMANLNNQINSLDRSKKNYEKAFKEAEKALENYQRAEADFDLSRAEVEKQRINMMTKGQLCEDSKSEYANQLQKTNDLQVSKKIFVVVCCLLLVAFPTHNVTHSFFF